MRNVLWDYVVDEVGLLRSGLANSFIHTSFDSGSNSRHGRS